MEDENLKKSITKAKELVHAAEEISSGSLEADNQQAELLVFMKKVDNLEPVRIFVNDKVAGDKGMLIVGELNYMAQRSWIMEKKPTADGYFMKFTPPKRIITV